MAINVLVVDDSAVMRKVIIRAMQLGGVPLGEVHEAADGREGLALLDRHWIGLALVDINMPVMGGEEMIDRVRATRENARLPIVVVTSDNSTSLGDQLRDKVQALVHKPFTPEELRDTIGRVLGLGDDGES